MSLNSPLIDVRLAAITPVAEEMKLFELMPLAGVRLPAAEPGSHIDLHLPLAAGTSVRQYSLLRSGASPQSYLVGIKREAGGRGGSLWLHEQAVLGQTLQISVPRNHFPLNAKASHSILIAGGIGITPIFNMACDLQARGQSWELHYGCRSLAFCAFRDELLALGGPVHFYFDDQHGPGAIDFKALAARAAISPGIDLYCCGPQGMLDAYERGCAALPAGRAHLEHFAAPAATSGTNGRFVIKLARSGREIEVAADRSILDCLGDAGIQVPYSCSQGVCGSCETRVIDGLPDHRDVVLSPEERAANTTMMVCCSRALTPQLILDL